MAAISSSPSSSAPADTSSCLRFLMSLRFSLRYSRSFSSLEQKQKRIVIAIFIDRRWPTAHRGGHASGFPRLKDVTHAKRLRFEIRGYFTVAERQTNIFNCASTGNKEMPVARTFQYLSSTHFTTRLHRNETLKGTTPSFKNDKKNQLFVCQAFLLIHQMVGQVSTHQDTLLANVTFQHTVPVSVFKLMSFTEFRG